MKKVQRLFSALLLLVFSVVACQPAADVALTDAPEIQTTAEVQQTVDETEVIEQTETPTVDDAVSVLLWLGDGLQDETASVDAASGMMIADSADEALALLDLTSEMPEGLSEVMHFSRVYVLAAPFPTLVDEASFADLKEFWHGTRAGNLLTVESLVLDSATLMLFTRAWGEPASETVKLIDDAFPKESPWDAGKVWTILPFDQLEPVWKVIALDGQSPIHQVFDESAYPLTLSFSLSVRQGASEAQLTQLDAWKSTIATSNRDADQMTTLIMTGVTAMVRYTAYMMETQGVIFPGRDIQEWLVNADITHISNEVSFWEKCPAVRPTRLALLFCSDPKYIELFEFVGADVIELTGNHNNDMLYVHGVDVVPFNLALYREYGLKFYGGGENLAESMQPALFEHNGNKIAFLGCNPAGDWYAWATETGGGAAPCDDYNWLVDSVKDLKADGWLPIVTFQYFENYSNTASDQMRADFRRVAEAGAVFVNGSQAHRPKEMEFYGDTFIHYGLGNLFFDQMGVTIDDQFIGQTAWEFIQRHVFYKGKLISTELLTAMLEDYARPRPMTERERIVFLKEIFEASGWLVE